MKATKNPSRVFRLAGAWHVKPDRQPRKTEIVGDSGIRYSYSDLRDRLLALYQQVLIRKQLELEEQHQAKISLTPPTLEAFTATATATTTTTATATLLVPKDFPQYKDITVPVPMAISLVCALGKAKDYLNGVPTLRNTSMASLARDLLGVQAEFSRLGQATSDDAYSLFIDACRRCSPGGGWDEREWEQIWASAVRSNPSSSIAHKISPDAVENCIKGEYWRWLKSQQNAPNGDAVAVAEPGDTIRNKALESEDKLIQDYKKLASYFGNRIRLNKLSKRIEINGQPVSIDRAKIQLAVHHGVLVKSCKEDILDIITELAEQNQYSPVENYLLSLQAPADTSILDNLAEKYFGVSSAIYQIFVRKTLIGAVARALSPGCKLDTALILQGKQGF